MNPPTTKAPSAPPPAARPPLAPPPTPPRPASPGPAASPPPTFKATPPQTFKATPAAPTRRLGDFAKSFSLTPGPGSAWPLFAAALRSIFYARKTPLLFLLLLIPVGIALIIEGAVGMEDYEENDQWGLPAPGQSPGLLWFEDASYGILFPFLIPLVVASFATAAIGEEVEGKTLPYLFTRPVYRSWILAAKGAGILLGTWFLAVFALTALWFTSVPMTQDPTRHLGILLGHYWVAALAILATGGLFLLLGVLMRRAIILIVLYLFVWEFGVSNFPLLLAKFTLVYYVRGILLEVTDRNTSALDFGVGEASSQLGHTVLLMLALVGLLSAFYVVSNKDYNV